MFEPSVSDFFFFFYCSSFFSLLKTNLGNTVNSAVNEPVSFTVITDNCEKREFFLSFFSDELPNLSVGLRFHRI